MIPSEQISGFLAFLREVEQTYYMAAADEVETNAETQDILHSLELEDHSYHQFAYAAKRLRGVRQRQRQAKDTMSCTAPVLAWAEENRAVVKSLERLLGEVRRAERSTENRIYTPRAKM